MSRYRIDWPRTIAGALAAVSAAALLSRLGPIGTLTGAAIGSVILSIGTSVYARGISRTHSTVMSARRRDSAEPPVEVADVIPVGSRPVQWKHIWLMAAAFFALALVLITAFEVATGRPLSSYVGGGGHGTSITNLTGRGAAPKPVPTPSQTPTPSPAVEPSSSPSASPSATPSPTPTPSSAPSAVGSQGAIPLL